MSNKNIFNVIVIVKHRLHSRQMSLQLMTNNMKVIHLGNNLNISCNDELDCQIKTSHFIGYVNKLIVNFGHLRGNVLNKLFKLYCCSFYGSQMWRLGSVYFNKLHF